MMTVGALGLYLKLRQLELPSGLLMIARFVGRNRPEDITLAERLGLFADDIALQILVIPVAASAIIKTISPRLRFPVLTFLLMTHVMLSYFGLVSLSSVGRYASGGMLADALRWSTFDPGIIGSYLSLSLGLKAGVVLGAAVAIAALDTARLGRVGRSCRCAVGSIGTLTIAAATGAIILGRLSRLEAIPQSRAAVISQLAALGSPEQAVRVVGSLDSVLAAFRQFTRTPATRPRSRHFGSERAKNVVIFVLETGPDSSLSFVAPGVSLPGVGQLAERAFVSSMHYTTYPYTSDAIFSILTGVYPGGRRQLLAAADSVDFGLFNVLARNGYSTKVYTPFGDVFEDDSRMFRLLGAEHRYIADVTDGPALRAAIPSVQAFIDDHVPDHLLANRRKRIAAMARDLVIVEQFKLDLEEHAKTGRPFAALLLPTIGHGPWRDLFGDSTKVSQGRSLMLLQDRWLAGIVDHLRQLELLDDTMILVTADHGIRTRVEDPDLPPGMLSRISFNVPFLLYAPATISRTTVLPFTTSHIDIVPSVLALLGVESKSRYPTQGVPVWDAGADRTVFFFAEEYLGASGMFDGSRYWMWQPLVDAVMVAPTLDFTAPAARVANEADSDSARVLLRRIKGLQLNLMRGLADWELSTNPSSISSSRGADGAALK